MTTAASLARLLLHRCGAATLPGSAFGEPPAALRLRLATALLYGDTPDQQETALATPDPTTLPWIAAALTRLSQILTDLANRPNTSQLPDRRAEQSSATAASGRPRWPDHRASPATPADLEATRGFTHASLRVCLVRVTGTVMIAVLGLGLGLGWPPAEAVHAATRRPAHNPGSRAGHSPVAATQPPATSQVQVARSEARTNDLEMRRGDGHTRPRGRPP